MELGNLINRGCNPNQHNYYSIVLRAMQFQGKGTNIALFEEASVTVPQL